MNARRLVLIVVATNLDGLRFLVGTALFVYASVSDLRTRRVGNMTWLIGAAAGVVLLLADYAMGRPFEWLPLVLILVIVAVAYGMWYVHLIAGGADAKAIMMLAVLAPFALHVEVLGRTFPVWSSPLPPAFVVFANSLLVFLVVPFAFLAWNLLRGDMRFPAMFLGYRMSVDRAAKSFVWVMERVAGDGGARQVLFSSKLSREEHAANLEGLRAAGRTRVWVTPKIPFMVPLLGGFLLTFIVGDAFTRLILLAMGRSP